MTDVTVSYKKTNLRLTVSISRGLTNYEWPYLQNQLANLGLDAELLSNYESNETILRLKYSAEDVAVDEEAVSESVDAVVTAVIDQFDAVATAISQNQIGD